MSEGESLRSICRCDDMPSMGAVFKWLAKHDEFREQYGLAMSARADSMFEEMLDIADDGTNDWMLTNDGDERFNTEHVQRSRLRLDTRKWMLARMSPRKYGDKIPDEVVGNDSDIEIRVVRVSKNKDAD